jgi:two-component system, NarL family, response regulator DevR
MPIKVLIVDDHEVVRLGLTTILKNRPNYILLGEAKDATQCIEMVKKETPDVIIMDIRLPDMNGIETCREILKDYPMIKVLMLTSYADEDAATASILAGAKGFILKQAGSSALIDAIEKVYSGYSLIDPIVKDYVVERLSREIIQDEQLSEREIEVLREVAKGYTNKEIALTLSISEKTVRNYVSKILAKLNFSHRTQAAIYAVKKGWVVKD